MSCPHATFHNCQIWAATPCLAKPLDRSWTWKWKRSPLGNPPQTPWSKGSRREAWLEEALLSSLKVNLPSWERGPCPPWELWEEMLKASRARNRTSSLTRPEPYSSPETRDLLCLDHRDPSPAPHLPFQATFFKTHHPKPMMTFSLILSYLWGPFHRQRNQGPERATRWQQRGRRHSRNF